MNKIKISKKIKRKMNKIIAFSLVILSTLMLSACGEELDGYIQVYETTGTKSKLMSRQSDLVFDKLDDSSVNSKIIISDKEKRQKVEGYGAAITHSSAYVLMQMDEEKRTEILSQLFSDKDGVGFDLIRLPIGSSDYSGIVDGKLKHFSLDDVKKGETDEKLEKFNIDVDMDTIIPIVKEIQKINPHIKIVSSPWSAPAWMKNTESLHRGVLLEEYEEVYTDYFIKYLEKYKEQGINIKYLTLQNEPLLDNRDYPVMQMDEFQQLRLIKSIGKKLKSHDLEKVKILAYDFNYSAAHSADIAENYIDTILSDKTVNKYVAGVALHGYENEGLEDFAPGFDFVQNYNKMSLLTEIAEGTWSVDFASNLSYSLSNVVLGPLNHFSSGSIYWNAVLYQDGGPVLGGGENSLGLVSVNEDGSYSMSAGYYSMAHVSKFINSSDGKEGVVLKTECESPNIIAATIRRSDGKIVTIAVNTSDKFAETIDVTYKTGSFTYDIQPQSVVTFIW